VSVLEDDATERGQKGDFSQKRMRLHTEEDATSFVKYTSRCD
jgi:hypothetical protein